MADTILGLDIAADRLVAVAVENSSSSHVGMVKRCAVVDVKEQSFAAALRQIKEQIDVVGFRCLVTLNAEYFSYRNLTLPFADRKKIDQVLPFELVDLSPVDVGSLAIDSMVAAGKGSESTIIAAMINKDLLMEKLSALIEAGFDPDSIGISGVHVALRIAEQGARRFVLMDFDTCWTRIFVVVDGQVVLIRSLVSPLGSGSRSSNVISFAQTVKQTLLTSRSLNISDPDYPIYFIGCESLRKTVALVLPSVLEGGNVETYRQSNQPLIKIDPEVKEIYQPDVMDKVLALGLKGADKIAGFNFRKGLLKKKTSFKEYQGVFMKLSVPLGIILVSAVVYLLYGYSSMLTTRDQIKTEIETVFRETLPEVTRIVNPVQQLQVANNEMKATLDPGGNGAAGQTVIDVLIELSIRIPASYMVKIVRLIADGDTIRIKGVTGDFNTVDGMQKELEKSPYFRNVTISSANQSSKGDGVGFELKVERARN